MKQPKKHLHVELQPEDEQALTAGLAAFKQLGDAGIRARSDLVRVAIHNLSRQAISALEAQRKPE